MPAPSPESLVDVVDDDDRVVAVAPRADLLDRGLGFRTAHVLLFDGQQRLLLQQLGAERHRNPLMWGSSVAAHLHAGEKYEEAAARRLQEELGLTAPLTEVGVVPLVDGSARKFVGVFTADDIDHDASIHEHSHIQALAWMDWDDVVIAVDTHPETFTDTFRAVLAYAIGARAVPLR